MVSNCLHCGGESAIIHDRGEVAVKCTKCEIRTIFFEKLGTALSKWNRRDGVSSW